MDGMSLLDVLRGVMLDPAEQAVYDADPGAYLGQYGYQDVDAADLSEAFGLVADTLPADQAMAAWTGESGPESPLLGDDTTDFDVGDLDGAALTGDDAGDPVDDLDDLDDVDGVDGVGADDGTDTGADEPGDEPALSFGLGEDEAAEAGDARPDDLDGDLGLFGTAAPDDTDTGGLDAAGPDEEGDVDLDDAFGTFAADDPGDDLGDHDGLGHGLADDVDDVDDLAEIEGLGPVDDGPDELDIGSF